MNSIDNVLARIQEIITRIHEIQATQGRVTGFGPGASPGAASTDPGAATPAGGVAAGNAAGRTSGTAAAAEAKNPDFQTLLQGALAAEGSTLSGSAGGSNGVLSGLGSLANPGPLGSLTNLGSVLGTGGGTTESSGNSAALEKYRNELVKAIRQLAAEKNKPSKPTQ